MNTFTLLDLRKFAPLLLAVLFTTMAARPALAAYTAVDDNVTVMEDGTVVINVLDNDNCNGQSCYSTNTTLSILVHPQHGTAQVSPSDKKIIYTPSANYYGTDLIKY